MSGSLPLPIWVDASVVLPAVNADTLVAVAPTAIMLAAVGLIETLMTKTMIDDMTKMSLSNVRECVALGTHVQCTVLCQL